jgi:hypothetical protein
LSEIDYEELIKSPLDDVEAASGASWSSAVPGAAVGLLLGWLLTLVGGDDAAATVTTVPTTTQPPVAVVAPDYPPGYAEIAPGLAASGSQVVLGDDSIVVAFTTATQRGIDPAEVAWPIGGSWLLESESGTTVESARVVNGRFSPAAFAVHFPTDRLAGNAALGEARMLERWDVEEVSGSIELPFGEEPFAIEEPLSVPIDQSLTLIILRLELGRFLAAAEWQITGAKLGTTMQMAVRLLDADGTVVGSYERFPEVREPGEGGTLELFWSQPFPTDQEGAVTAVVDYTVGIVEAVPVSISFDLTDVPVGR